MKKFLRTLSFVFAMIMLLTMPTYADSSANARGSAFFSSYGTALEEVAPMTFRIWFDVDANAARMDVLGVSEIVVYRSFDGESGWMQTRVYDMDDYPEMTGTSTYSHTGYVTYDTAITGYYYRAYITFYAKDSRGTAERYIYTEILRMS